MAGLLALVLIMALAGNGVRAQDGARAQDQGNAAQEDNTDDAPPRKLDVPYVPTPQEVVDKMLELPNVTKDDVVYDLGCGDGRIVITAATRFGVRGVGVDIDPLRIRESKENARKAGVEERVQFFQKDLFDTDIREATVMTLYLLPAINLKLRPKLFRDLQPGTRIVSHSFDMGDWKPDQTVQVDGDGYPRTIHYWVLPATVAGTWQWNLPGAAGAQVRLQLSQAFQNVSGTLNTGGAETAITNAKLTGDKISFTVEQKAGEPMTFNGQVSGSTIKGTIKDAAGTRDWQATRESAPTSSTDTTPPGAPATPAPDTKEE